MDLDRPTAQISLAQTFSLTLTGFIWARFAMVISPANYNLMLAPDACSNRPTHMRQQGETTQRTDMK